MRIKKVSQTTPIQAQVVDGYSTSTEDSYSCNYVNEALNDLTPSTIELSKILWENPDPTQSFSQQNITLNSSDYDYLLVEFGVDNGATTPHACNIVKKGNSMGLTTSNMWQGSGSNVSYRSLTYISDTEYQVQNGFINGSLNNVVCVPIRIRGYKNTISSVVQKESEIYSTTEQRIGTWIDGKPLYRRVFVFTNIPVNSSQSLSLPANIDEITCLYGIAVTQTYTQPIPLVSTVDCIYQASIYTSTTDIIIETGSSRAIDKATAIIEYTKTTDTV